MDPWNPYSFLFQVTGIVDLLNETNNQRDFINKLLRAAAPSLMTVINYFLDYATLEAEKDEARRSIILLTTAHDAVVYRSGWWSIRNRLRSPIKASIEVCVDFGQFLHCLKFGSTPTSGDNTTVFLSKTQVKESIQTIINKHISKTHSSLSIESMHWWYCTLFQIACYFLSSGNALRRQTIEWSSANWASCTDGIH